VSGSSVRMRCRKSCVSNSDRKKRSSSGRTLIGMRTRRPSSAMKKVRIEPSKTKMSRSVNEAISFALKCGLNA
jgi:hypothetical protein